MPMIGLIPALLGFFLEFPRAVQVAVVGDGQGGLLEFKSPLDEVIDSIGAVEKGVFGVAVEMYEGHPLL